MPVSATASFSLDNSEGTPLGRSPNSGAVMSARRTPVRTPNTPRRSVMESRGSAWSFVSNAELEEIRVSAGATERVAPALAVTISDVPPHASSIVPASVSPRNDPAVVMPTPIGAVAPTRALENVDKTVMTLPAGARSLQPSPGVVVTSTPLSTHDNFTSDFIRRSPGRQPRSFDNRDPDPRRSKRGRMEPMPEISQSSVMLSQTASPAVLRAIEGLAPSLATTYGDLLNGQGKGTEAAFTSGLPQIGANEGGVHQAWRWIIDRMARTNASQGTVAARSTMEPPRSQLTQVAEEFIPRSSPDPTRRRDLESLADIAATHNVGGRGMSRPDGENEQSRTDPEIVGGSGAAVLGAGPSPGPAFPSTTAFRLSDGMSSRLVHERAMSRSFDEANHGTRSSVAEQSFLCSLLGMMDPADPRTARVRGAMVSRLNSITRTSP